MRNHRINKSSQNRGINQISDELSPLSDRSTGNPSGGNRKRPLVEEETIISGGGREGTEAKVMAANEAIGRGSEGKCVAEEVVEEASSGGVEDVGEHDVHGVFGADGAGAKHGEAELHREDEVGGEEKVGVIEGVFGVGEVVGDGGKLVADEICSAGGVGGVGT